MLKNFTKRAFTLAEVLITLAIIGTIAAMTIPSLIQNVRIDDKANDAGLKKNLRAINDATKQILIIDTSGLNMKNLTCASGSDNSQCLMDAYSKYINFVKTCKKDAQAPCLGDAPASSTVKCKNASGTLVDCALNMGGFPLGVVADGTIMAFNFAGKGTCNVSTEARVTFKGNSKAITNACAVIVMDVNGEKKPNGAGTDRFVVPIGQFGIKLH